MTSSWLRAAGLLVVAFATAGCRGTLLPDTRDLTVTGGWVILVYMSGDEELDEEVLRDVNEMEAAGLADSGVTVIALVDRRPGRRASGEPWTGTRMYQIVDDPAGRDDTIRSLPLSVPQLGIDPTGPDVALDMTDPATLASALGFVRERYEPDQFALVVWGRGSGFRAAVTTERGALHTAGLARALAAFPLDLLGFDTSYSASLEVAWEVREHAGLMVASQDAVPYGGWPYDELLRRFVASDRTSLALAGSIVESYADAHSTVAGATISALRLDRVPEVMDELNRLSDSLYDLIDSASSRDALRASLFYDVEDFYATPGDLSLDVGDIAAVLGRDHHAVSPQADALSAAVAGAVVANRRGAANPRASGLSVHLIPLRSDGSAEASHDPAYFRGTTVEHPLSFVEHSTWVPRMPHGPGLLYRLFYETM